MGTGHNVERYTAPECAEDLLLPTLDNLIGIDRGSLSLVDLGRHRVVGDKEDKIEDLVPDMAREAGSASYLPIHLFAVQDRPLAFLFLRKTSVTLPLGSDIMPALFLKKPVNEVQSEACIR